MFLMNLMFHYFRFDQMFRLTPQTRKFPTSRRFLTFHYYQ
jgi:hypothetical protein